MGEGLTMSAISGMISMIIHTYQNIMAKKLLAGHIGKIYGVTTLGERGQVVIPKELRSKLKMNDGDRFLVVEAMGRVVLAPERMLQEMIGQITKHLDK